MFLVQTPDGLYRLKDSGAAVNLLLHLTPNMVLMCGEKDTITITSNGQTLTVKGGIITEVSNA